jgi:hypothetical protein
MRRWLVIFAWSAALLVSRSARADGPDVDTWSTRLLHCSQSEDTAHTAIERMEQADLSVYRLLNPEPDSSTALLAARVDSTLRDLARAYRAYPEEQERIERIVLSWNYCDVFYGKRGWNLSVGSKGLERSPAEPPSDGWLGFRDWGFLPGGDRIVPTLFDRNPLFPSQKQWYVQLVFRRQCFPDPISGSTVFDASPVAGSVEGAVAVPRATAPPGTRPSVRELSCEVVEARAEGEKPTAAYEVSATAAVAQHEPAVISLAVPSEFQGDAPITLGIPTVAGDSWGFSGSLFDSYATGSGKSTVGARIGYSPIAYTYVRAGIAKEVSPAAGGLPTYTWGIGYNDWHAGTCSVELNNWGSTPISQFDLKGAQVDLGCKVPVPDLVSPYLGLGLGMTFPLAGGPSYGASLSLKPGGHWFAMMGLRFAPSRAEPWSFSYGFGNWSARPYTFSLGYNNWGPNSPWQGNFAKNGSLTFAWSWAL